MRWKQAGGETLAATDQPPPALALEGAHRFGAVDLAISRSAPAYDGRGACVEIERLYIDMIMAARRTIYAESQYFASRAVAQALAHRLSEPDGPEVILINPVKADNWLGSLAMDTARARLRESLRRHDTNGRFRIFHPVTANGTPIYVRCKIMIVDDRLLRIGSSNFNNRSMRFDNECDVATDAKAPSKASTRYTRANHMAKTQGKTVRDFCPLADLKYERSFDMAGRDSGETALVSGSVLADLAREDDRIVLGTADLQFATQMVQFRFEFPERLLQFGLSERNMLGAAAGLDFAAAAAVAHAPA